MKYFKLYFILLFFSISNKTNCQVNFSEVSYFKDYRYYSDYFLGLKPQELGLQGIWDVIISKTVFLNNTKEKTIYPKKYTVALIKTENNCEIKFLGYNNIDESFKLELNTDSFQVKYLKSESIAKGKTRWLNNDTFYIEYWIPTDEVQHKLDISDLSANQNPELLYRIYFNKRDAFKTQINSIVETDKKIQIVTGSSFHIGNGYLVTNNHVIEGKTDIKAYVNGSLTKCSLVSTDLENDLAILKVEDNFLNEKKGLRLIGTDIKTGQDVFTLGYPLVSTMGKEIKLTTGIISSTTGILSNESIFQISAPVQPGNSGGPAFNQFGNVIGVVVAKYTEAENVSYCIKAKYVIDLIKKHHIQNLYSNTENPTTLEEQVEVLKYDVFIIISK